MSTTYNSNRKAMSAREAGALSVDQARFLVLAAALATGCSSSDKSDKSSDGGSGGSSNPSTGGMHAGGATGGSTGSGGSSSGGSAGSGGAAGGSTGSGGLSSGGSAGSGGAAGSAGSDAGACYGDNGTGTCPSDISTDCAVFCASNAEGLSTVSTLRGGVAQEFITCVQEGLASTCTVASGLNCLQGALSGACPDSTADAPCSTIEGACAGTANAITPGVCHSLVDGLTATGRDIVVACMTSAPDGGVACQKSLWSCVEGLPY